MIVPYPKGIKQNDYPMNTVKILPKSQKTAISIRIIVCEDFQEDWERSIAYQFIS